MYGRMLVVLDGSKQAESVLGRTAVLAAKNNSEIVLLMVLPTPTMIVEYGRIIATLDQEAERAQATVQPYLEGVKARLNASGVKASVAVRFGDPAKAISEYARWNGVDLIVMSAKARKGLSALVRRSVADKVVHSAAAPVLLMSAA